MPLLMKRLLLPAGLHSPLAPPCPPTCLALHAERIERLSIESRGVSKPNAQMLSSLWMHKAGELQNVIAEPNL